MDPHSRELFLVALSRLSTMQNSSNLVSVTHHIEEILPIFAKTLALRDGKVLRSSATNEVLTSETMKELYDVSLTLLHKKGRYWPISD